MYCHLMCTAVSPTACRRRMDSMTHTEEDRLPREFNFLHIAEQAMEVEFSRDAGKSAALFLFMSIFLFVSSG